MLDGQEDFFEQRHRRLLKQKLAEEVGDRVQHHFREVVLPDQFSHQLLDKVSLHLNFIAEALLKNLETCFVLAQQVALLNQELAAGLVAKQRVVVLNGGLQLQLHRGAVRRTSV